MKELAEQKAAEREKQKSLSESVEKKKPGKKTAYRSLKKSIAKYLAKDIKATDDLPSEYIYISIGLNDVVHQKVINVDDDDESYDLFSPENFVENYYDTLPDILPKDKRSIADDEYDDCDVALA